MTRDSRNRRRISDSELKGEGKQRDIQQAQHCDGNYNLPFVREVLFIEKPGLKFLESDVLANSEGGVSLDGVCDA